MATHSSNFAREIKDRGAYAYSPQGVAKESDTVITKQQHRYIERSVDSWRLTEMQI